MTSIIPAIIPNWIAGKEVAAQSSLTFDKFSPHSGQAVTKVARSNNSDVQLAIAAAKASQLAWAETPGVQRGAILHRICNYLEQHQNQIAQIVGLETGKAPQGGAWGDRRRNCTRKILRRRRLQALRKIHDQWHSR